jgi:hypothetical protein
LLSDDRGGNLGRRCTTTMPRHHDFLCNRCMRRPTQQLCETCICGIKKILIIIMEARVTRETHGDRPGQLMSGAAESDSAGVANRCLSFDSLFCLVPVLSMPIELPALPQGPFRPARSLVIVVVTSDEFDRVIESGALTTTASSGLVDLTTPATAGLSSPTAPATAGLSSPTAPATAGLSSRGRGPRFINYK